ncbi:MAG: hypothetical protein AAGD00_01535 [Planctomycetota bacterium]
MMRNAASKILFGYGLFLIVCGFLGWAATGFTSSGKTAILSGGMSGVLVLASAVLAGRPAKKMQMIGAHLGLVLPLLFAIPFTWRGIVGWQATAAGEDKLYVAILLSSMALASVVVFVLLLVNRPKPAASPE